MTIDDFKAQARRLAEDDPLARDARRVESPEHSPMDPPDAFEPPQESRIDADACHPFFRDLLAEHRDVLARLEAFEATLAEVEKDGVDAETGQRMLDFLTRFEARFPAYRRRHDGGLFPLLRERMIERGEHGRTAERRTGVDVLERDHDVAFKQAVVARALLAVAMCLPDPASTSVALGYAAQQAHKLVETVRLLVFRKEHFIYGLAEQLLSTEELDGLVHAAPADDVAEGEPAAP